MANFRIITPKDKEYPKLLKEIAGFPKKLWIRGEIKKEDEKALAVVGARKMTGYGREVTESLVSQLVFYGLTIVSGLARGVDSCAHKAALDAGGRTIAVLGSGIDVIYPWENKKLSEEIINGRGAIISEFEPGTPPYRQNFPARNRIIAGLSLGVLVTEAAEISGSLITARLGGEFGREVFAVPGPIHSKMSVGTASLIKDGAKLVYKIEDILEELPQAASTRRLATSINTTGRSSLASHNSQEADLILKLLDNEPKSVDQIVAESGLSAPRVLSFLSLMEVAGLVKNIGQGVFTKR